MPTFKETPPTQIIHEVAMPLFAIDHTGRSLWVSGTAFIVGRGYAVTAYHVIEDFLARYDFDVTKNEINSFQLLGILSLDGDTRHLPLKMMRIWRRGPLDIALMAVGVPADWPDQHRWKAPMLDLLPPRVGDEIFGFGFANSSAHELESEIPQMQLHPRTTTGKVIEVHHLKRDSTRLGFPCFRTNARFDGGMSGGPVFNFRTGHVCGVICSSLPPGAQDVEHVSYASSLWPIVGTLIDSVEPPGGEQFPAMRLFERQEINASDLACSSRHERRWSISTDRKI